MFQKKGFSLIELLLILSITSILLGTAIFGFKSLLNPAKSATDQLVTLIKVVRAKAISDTVAYKLEPSGSGQLVASHRDTCNSTEAWVSDGTLTLNLPSGSYLDDYNWSVCYDTRGFPDANVVFSISENGSVTKTIEIYLGGGISST